MSAQMGVMWLTIEVHGLPVHASVAHTGLSAIGYAQQMVAWLLELETAWNRPQARHVCYADHPHPINFNLGRIAGGEWTSSVPTHCRVDMRLGFYPGRTPAEVRAEVEAHLAASHARHPGSGSLNYSIRYRGFQAQGLAEVARGGQVPRPSGSAARPNGDGTQQALEVHIFPEEMRGTGEGHWPYTPVLQATMTNDLKVGASCTVTAATPRKDGSFEANRIHVGRKGIVPQ